MNIFLRSFIIIGFCLSAAPAFSQLVFDAVQHTNKYILEPLNAQKIESEDAQFLNKNSPLPIGRTTPVKITPKQLYKNTDILIINPDAKATSLYFENFVLKNDASLKILNMDGDLLFFTQKINAENYIIPQLAEDSLKLIFEYKNLADIDFNLNEIGNIYRSSSVKKDTKGGLNSSKKCQVNINCSEGNEYQDQKNSVVQIEVYAGGIIFECSGVLMNNTAKDKTPYILSAMHCGTNSISGKLIDSADFKKWIFYFNYEASGCKNPVDASEVSLNYVTGSIVIANSADKGGDEGSDFVLLKLIDKIPNSFNPYYAGWSLKNKDVATNGVCIHHPNGDIKKVSTFNKIPILASFGGNVFAHWQVNWIQTDHGFGTTESGSSGAPIFNENKQVFGILSGGLSDCGSPNDPDYFGKLSYSWSMNGPEPEKGLKKWLDPLNSKVYFMDGMYWSDSSTSSFKKTFLSKINFYPNPVVNQLNISLPENYETYQIFDSKGMSMGNKNTIEKSEFSISVAELPSGFYMIHFIGNSSNSIKFIKQ